MKNTPARLGATLSILAAGCGFGLTFPAAAQTADDPGSPAAVAGMPHTDAKGRHLAPHDTFYMLEYVSATTDKGVEGFEPGQEVHLVEVHRPAHTLVVSDGRAQVEVPPSKLTNDMDIAALVRAKDQSNQAKITAYVQAEQVAYEKYEKEAADATAKDIEHHNQQQAASSTVGGGTAVDAPTQQTGTTVAGEYNAGYYGTGGYGYGSPYSYFGGGGSNTVVLAQQPQRSAPAAPAQPAAPPGQVAAPSHGGGAGGGKAK